MMIILRMISYDDDEGTDDDQYNDHDDDQYDHLMTTKKVQ